MSWRLLPSLSCKDWYLLNMVLYLLRPICEILGYICMQFSEPPSTSCNHPLINIVQFLQSFTKAKWINTFLSGNRSFYNIFISTVLSFKSIFYFVFYIFLILLQNGLYFRFLHYTLIYVNTFKNSSRIIFWFWFICF